MLLRWVLGGLRVPDRVRNRLGYSLAGIAWSSSGCCRSTRFRSDLQFDIEMFFLSGMMLVLGGVWTVMYNSDLLLGARCWPLGRRRSAGPGAQDGGDLPHAAPLPHRHDPVHVQPGHLHPDGACRC